MYSIPLSIFVNSESPSQHDQQQAWAAALVLIVGVLLTSSIARILSARARSQGTGQWLVPRARRGPKRIQERVMDTTEHDDVTSARRDDADTRTWCSRSTTSPSATAGGRRSST